MKSFKHFSLLIACLMSLVACGGNNNKSSSSTEQSEQPVSSQQSSSNSPGSSSNATKSESDSSSANEVNSSNSSEEQPPVSSEASSSSESSGEASSEQQSSESSSNAGESSSSENSQSSEESGNSGSTSIEAFVKAINAFDKATSYSLTYVNETRETYNDGALSIENHVFLHSENDYRDGYFRNYTYTYGDITMPYTALKTASGLTDETFESHYQEMLYGQLYVIAKSYSVDTENDKVKFIYDNRPATPDYTYGGYDEDAKQWYYIMPTSTPGSYDSRYCLDGNEPTTISGLGDVLLTDVTKISYNETTKAYEYNGADELAPFFAGAAPSKLSAALDDAGNLSKLEATFDRNGESYTMTLSISNIGSVPEFSDMPVLDCIGCKEHMSFNYEVTAETHRKYCDVCNKYLSSAEAHSNNNDYNYCKECERVVDLEPFDDPDLIKDATADYDYYKYYFALQKSPSTNRIYDTTYYHSEIDRLQIYDTNRTIYWDKEASLLIVTEKNENIPDEEIEYLFTDQCVAQTKQMVYVYKGVTVAAEAGEAWKPTYTFNQQSPDNFLKTVTPNKTFETYLLSEYHLKTDERITKIDDCNNKVEEVCERCGKAINIILKDNHNWSISICTLDQIKEAFPDVDVDKKVEYYDLDFFFKIECDKCQTVEYCGLEKNEYSDLYHVEESITYYSFTTNTIHSKGESPFGHIMDNNGVCYLCGCKEVKIGDIKICYRDVTADDADEGIELVFPQEYDLSQTSYEFKGNVVIAKYDIHQGETVVGTVEEKEVQYDYSSCLYYFKITFGTGENAQVFEFTSAFTGYEPNEDDNNGSGESGNGEEPHLVGTQYNYEDWTADDGLDDTDIEYIEEYVMPLYVESYFVIGDDEGTIEFGTPYYYQTGTYVATENENEYLVTFDTIDGVPVGEGDEEIVTIKIENSRIYYHLTVEQVTIVYAIGA